MSVDELRALIAKCDQMERKLQGKFSKGRRGWSALRASAQAEIDRR